MILRILFFKSYSQFYIWHQFKNLYGKKVVIANDGMRPLLVSNPHHVSFDQARSPQFDIAQTKKDIRLTDQMTIG